MRKICIITGSRADYGLLRLTIDEIEKSQSLELKLIATGMHLSPDFGNTFKEIENDGFRIDYKLPILDGRDSAENIIKAMSRAMESLPGIYKALDPDLILVLGDRFEIFTATYVAHILNIPIAHIHGGESTEGAFDEEFRHSITKMSHLHFASTESYKKRIIQLGERPNTVFNFGAPGVEAIKKVKLYKKNELESSIGFKIKDKSLLITFHPETLISKIKPIEQVNNLLNVLNDLRDTTLIFTKSNADTGGISINQEIDKFVANNPLNSIAFSSLGQKRYFSTLQFVDGVVGNSSSGLLEVPSFNIGTVNIGNRQKGRIRAESVIDTENNKDSIRKNITKLYEKEFQAIASNVDNPYDGGKTSVKITNVLKEFDLHNIITKQFYDL